MGAVSALLLVALLALVPLIGVGVFGLYTLFGIVVPYAAVLVFVIGLSWRAVAWVRVPVPFRIPLTAGQQRSLPWIRTNPIGNPSNGTGVLVRVALEVLLFRSLLRNATTLMDNDGRVTYWWDKWLWLAGLAFHWSLFIIVLRHLRLFTQPVPHLVLWLQRADGLLQVNLQPLFMTDTVIILALTYLLLRRVIVPRLRYVSILPDYVLPVLILAVAGSGILMTYWFRVDMVAVKTLALSLATLKPILPEGIGTSFFVHLFLVSILFAVFPFTKLVHILAAFLSPTTTLANNNRARRHVNPWNYSVPVHSYEEYEEEFRDKLERIGVKLEGDR